jgi:hypothetical protein
VNLFDFLMPRKIRELIQDLKAAGWRQVSGGRGRTGDSSMISFQAQLMIPGHENDDAKPYLEKQVRNAAKGKAHERK